MKNEDNNSTGTEGTDEIYASRNKLIRWLGDRLFRAVFSLMPDMTDCSLSGLNVGCGEGQMISRLFFSGMRNKMTAIDIDPVRIAFASRCHPGCCYSRADVFHLPFRARTFDYVIATEVLEHLASPEDALIEIARVTKPDSPVIISVPNEPFFQWGNLIRGKYWKRGGRTPSHVQFWNRTQFQSLIGNYLEIQEDRWISCFPWQLYRGKLKSIFRDQ